MNTTINVLTGAAAYLADAGLGLTYRDSGAYAKTEVGIRFYDAPQTPDRVVILTPYSPGDEVRVPVSTLALQVRCRGPAGGDPRPAQDLDDAIFDVLQAAEHLHLGDPPIHVATITRRSSLPMGVDGSGRWETSSSYYLTLDRPTLWRNS